MTTRTQTQITSAEELVSLSPVIPVVVLDDVEHAVPLAQALVRGGVGVIEVTLRTPAGLPAIARIAEEVPDIVVGAGTVTTADQVAQAAEAGAGFLVLPGAPEGLLSAALEPGLPLLPGACTLTEMMRLREQGLTVMKFFPAGASGGTAFLSAVAGPLPDLRFCPTGGIEARTAADYLALPNVACVGGSWLTSKEALRSRDWAEVEALARAASGLAVA